MEQASINPHAPFGCVLFDRDLERIVASGVNRSRQSPLKHGEMVAMENYTEAYETCNWPNISLYTTAEPCCMCQGAILWSGIGRVVFGSSISKLIELGWRQIDITATKLAQLSWKPDLEILGGVRQADCDELFQQAMLLRG